MDADLRLGRWEEVLEGVEVDAVITDPPYSARVHEGHDAADRIASDAADAGAFSRVARRTLPYSHWTTDDVDAFVDAWAPRCRGWLVCLSDNTLCEAYRAAYERNGLAGFAPVVVLIPGMTVRMAGDGPSSWAVYANVGRPKALRRWGTLPGGYTGPPGERVHIGGKPLWLMRALVRDYSRRGGLVCDPCAGAGTTLLAALQENRRAIGAEVDHGAHAAALARLRAGYTPAFDFGDAA